MKEVILNENSLAQQFLTGKINKSEFIEISIKKFGRKGIHAFRDAEKLEKKFGYPPLKN